MTGKNLITKATGNKFWAVDMKIKNSRGKKTAWTKAEAKNASRKVRHNNSYLKEVA